MQAGGLESSSPTVKNKCGVGWKGRGNGAGLLCIEDLETVRRMGARAQGGMDVAVGEKV